MHKDLAFVMFEKERIEERVLELGRQISEDYKGEEVLMVGIMKGAIVFYADLIRAVSIPVSVDFMSISSYGNSTKSTGVPKFIKDLDCDAMDKNVIIVEDIVDSGMTLQFLKENLLKRGAKSIKICVLLDKPDRRRTKVDIDYRGFFIPDEFVVGYGLDYAERYREIPYIGVLKPEIYTNADA